MIEMSNTQRNDGSQDFNAFMTKIGNCKDFNQFLHIDENVIIGSLRILFSEFLQLHHDLSFLRDSQFYQNLKRLSQAYTSLAAFFVRDHNMNSRSQPESVPQKNEQSSQQIAKRKATRSFYAMRNVKNQEQLKKDQIFVRLIPRSQACIQFMLNNRNFPRIELKLSCNQHLEYLVNYLTNKWLRGKVGVGYQIVLYPDSNSYLKKIANSSEKKSEILNEPFNNYLMLTDIMSAYNASQNACINIYYDIAQLRKQKIRNIHSIKQKEGPYHPQQSHFLGIKNKGEKQKNKQESVMDQIPAPSMVPYYKNQSNGLSLEKRIEQNARQIMMENSLCQDHSLNLKAFSKKYLYHNQNSNLHFSPHEEPYGNHIDEEDYGSLAFNWNAYNSNLLAGSNNALFAHNSNSYLQATPRNNSSNPPNQNSEQNKGFIGLNKQNHNKEKESGKQEMDIQNSENYTKNMAIRQKESKSINNNLNTPISYSSEAHANKNSSQKKDNLDNIRNFINMIEMEEPKVEPQNIYDGQEVQIQNAQSNSNMHRKQVKTISVIKKKNINQG